MTTEQVPDWAIERALELTGNPYGDTVFAVQEGSAPEDKMHAAFAAYIAKHEKPPIDPDVELLAQIYDVTGCETSSGALREGEITAFDHPAIAIIKAARERWQGGKP